MLNIMVTEMDGRIDAFITGNGSLEEAVKDLKEAGSEEEHVIAHMQFNDEENSVLTAIESLCCINSEFEDSFCKELEKMFTVIFNAGIKYGMRMADIKSRNHTVDKETSKIRVEFQSIETWS